MFQSTRKPARRARTVVKPQAWRVTVGHTDPKTGDEVKTGRVVLATSKPQAWNKAADAHRLAHRLRPQVAVVCHGLELAKPKLAW